MNVLLPIEDVSKLLDVVNQNACICLVQQIVIAEKTFAAVVINVQVVSRFHPQDVVEDFGSLAAVGHTHVVAARRKHRVADHSHVING